MDEGTRMPAGFDEEGDPSPISARVAVARAKRRIHLPMMVVCLGTIFVSALLGASGVRGIAAAAAVVVPLVAVFVWGHVMTVRWIDWALARGAHPRALHKLAARQRLLSFWGNRIARAEARHRQQLALADMQRDVRKADRYDLSDRF